jgi:NADP-dependent 3-hydroxy acid dehydrogenase YdfG
MAKQPRILVGQVAAVTGGARGIGKATAQAFVREGMKVAIGDLDGDLARAAAAELGPNAAGFELDVTRRDSFEAFVDAAEERFGALDVLVNNAGIMPLGRFIDEDDATAVRMIDINLHGVIYGMKIALPRMMARNRGHVVNIASQAGKYGAAGGATYSATKHAVVGLTEAVRSELRVEGSAVELSYVMPFVVKTELGTGTQDARGMKKLEPGDVADAIVDALKHGVVEVWAPRSSRHTHRLRALLPRRAWEGMARAMKADQVLMGADHRARAAYELRAAHSEPGLEPGEEPRRLAS